jgi:hypothetical protein
MLFEKNTIYEWEGSSIEVQVDENTQYLMTADAGTLTSEAKWRIKKVVQANSGAFGLHRRVYNPVSLINAKASINAEFVADDFASYTYA